MKIDSNLKAVWLRRSLFALAMLGLSIPLASAADSSVAAVQKVLKQKHFYFGEIDGNWDEATQGALRRFQFRNGLAGTAEIDEATLQALAIEAPRPRVVVANLAAQAERDPQPAPVVEKSENPTILRATAVVDQPRKFSVSLETKDQRTAPRAGFTEQFPSWSAQHRGGVEDGIEIRRAIPISKADPMGEPGVSGEVAVTVPAYFTGQDGHVYTYYRKMKTSSPDASRLSTPLSGIGATALASPPEVSDGDRNTMAFWGVADRR